MEPSTDAVGRLAELIAGSRRTIALTGAGMSTESGLPDYRGATGLWRNRRFEELASVRMWATHPVEFWVFYHERIRAIGAARPNPGHLALAELERRGALDLVITQNVDGLHQAAGSRAVHEAHGTLAEVECLACRWRGPSAVAHDQLDAGAEVPVCPACGDVLKPAVVLFGELLSSAFATVASEVERCDVLLVLGTSLQVPPVAYLPGDALGAGATLAIVNDGPTAFDARATVRIAGRTGEILPELLARLPHGGS